MTNSETNRQPKLVALIDSERRMGTVTAVAPHEITVNLRAAVAAWGRRNRASGAVGEFVAIDCDSHVVLARITRVKIPERQRGILERDGREGSVFTPEGILHPVASVDKATDRLDRGVAEAPRVGDPVYSLPDDALLPRLERAMTKQKDEDRKGGDEPVLLTLGSIAQLERATVRVPPEALFGRHCGIFGATGGGKSWTIGRLAAEIHRLGGKAILIDATGEHSKQREINNYVTIAEFYTGQERKNNFDYCSQKTTIVYFPYREMSEKVLFQILRPAPGTQEPVLRDAIRDLRLAHILSEQRKSNNCFLEDNVIVKRCKYKSKYEDLIREVGRLDHETCNFDISYLTRQIEEECIWENHRADNNKFGDRHEKKLSDCQTLITRIYSNLIRSKEFKYLGINIDKEAQDIMNFVDEINNFLNTDERIYVADVSTISFKYHAREILIEIIGDYLMRQARAGKFRDSPLIVILDEAHQFLGRDLGDRDRPFPLEAFGLIAKEGRKYGLSVVIATQRPRDVPQDVLSQLGTFIVHRLTSHHDREVIERACGEFERGLADFLPSLTQGEALVLGVDLPVALPVRIHAPSDAFKPDSRGPNFSGFWSKRSGTDGVEDGEHEGAPNPPARASQAQAEDAEAGPESAD